ncbi:BAX protein [hydrothermal vent metagenome]|uniref:BAX protein n=1 Tax=hydrothermal vent metagenome TaxID=652676 RepID=A0A1W1C2F4_9ZZZZ
MIKYFLIFISVTITTFSLDDVYIAEVAYAIEADSNLDVYQEPKTSCNKLAMTVNKRINSPKDITIFKKKMIAPINYTSTVSLNKLQVSEKKQKFFYMILPAILISKQKLKVQRAKVEEILQTVNPTSDDLIFLDNLYKKYRTNDGIELLSRMKTHPVSIVLAQAAIESAWGESRFFKKGNNIFGMWSYNKNEPRIRARETRNGKPVYLRKYKSISDAIDDYFVTIGRGAYESFRKQRDITKDPLKLVEYLINYCELRGQYTKKLKKFIIANNLEDFDDFQIDEMYLTSNF